MVLLSESPLVSTPDSELEDTTLLRLREDTLVLVKEEVLERPECPPRSSG